MSHKMPSVLVLIAALFVVVTAQSNFVELTRIFGIASRNTYALVCKRAANVANAFVFTSAPPTALDTAGRNNATVHCIARVLHALNSNCSHLNATQFQRYAQPVLDHCVQRPRLSAADAADVRPFFFERSTCVSKVAWSSNDVQSSVAFVCECSQSAFYEVTPGWARRIIDGKEADTAEEVQATRMCAEEADQQMSDICVRRPGDYDVLGLQILQACCKRVRVQTQGKFDCAAVVPADLRDLKFEF